MLGRNSLSPITHHRQRACMPTRCPHTCPLTHMPITYQYNITPTGWYKHIQIVCYEVTSYERSRGKNLNIL